MRCLCFANVANADIAASVTSGTYGTNAVNIGLFGSGYQYLFLQFGTVHFPYLIELTRNGARGGKNGGENQSGRTDEKLNRGENTKGVNWEEETKSRNGKGKRSKMNRAEELTWNGARC